VPIHYRRIIDGVNSALLRLGLGVVIFGLDWYSVVRADRRRIGPHLAKEIHMCKFQIVALGGALLLGGLLALAQDKPGQTPPAKAPAADGERKVKETEVPKAALDALKKLAGSAEIKEFAQETENGHKFYEGSWAGPNGNIDALVTDGGDLVEIEETIAADKVPAVVRADVSKAAGKDAAPTFEKKTMVLYEAHFKKDGEGHEMVLTPDGRHFEEGGAKNAKDEKDEDGDDD